MSVKAAVARCIVGRLSRTGQQQQQQQWLAMGINCQDKAEEFSVSIQSGLVA
jgi:hypothetical protein